MPREEQLSLTFGPSGANRRTFRPHHKKFYQPGGTSTDGKTPHWVVQAREAAARAAQAAAHEPVQAAKPKPES